MARQTIAVSILADASGVKRGVNSSLGLLKKLAVGFAAFKGAQVLSKSIKEGFASVQLQEKLLKQSEAVLKSTGAAAGVTTSGILKLSDAIERKSLIDAEQIQNSQNLLLTFTSVRNEVGKGNNVFDQATQTIADMSTALGTDMKESTIQVGKALNDPVAGISALSRVGVTFTAGQKDQIKAMVASGDTMKAQKVILKELNKEFGGSAKAAGSTFAGQVKHLKDTWDGFVETGIKKIMPYLTILVANLATKLPVAIANVSGFLKSLRPRFETGANVVRAVVAGVLAFGNSGDEAGTRVDKLRKTLGSVMDSIKSIIGSTVAITTALWSTFGQTILTFTRQAFDAIIPIISGAFTIVAGIFKTVAALLKGDWSGVWNGIKQILSGAWTAIKGIVRLGWATIKGLFKVAGLAIAGIFKGMWSGIKSLAAKGLNGIIGAVKSLPGRVRALGGLLKAAGKSIITSFVAGLKNAGGAIGGIAGSVWTALKGLLNGAITKINNALEFKIKIPGAPDLHINPPNIPFLAKGGYVTKPTLAVIGEAGPEYVIPANKMGGVEPLALKRANSSGVHIYHINVEVKDTMTAVEQGRKISNMLKEFQRSQGQGR